MMGVKKRLEDWCDDILTFPTPPKRKIIAIDMLNLLEFINSHPPENITQLNSIILNQQRFELEI